MGETLVLEEAKEFKEYELLPEDTILEAKITSAKKVTTKMIDEDTGEPVVQVEFVFLAQDEPYKSENRKFWGKTSTKFSAHEKCRLYSWTKEIMSVNELKTGFVLDLDALVGNHCRIVLDVNTWDDKKQTNPDGTPVKRSNNPVKEVIRSRNTGPSVGYDESEPF